jgi:dienelactone hydrolase
VDALRKQIRSLLMASLTHPPSDVQFLGVDSEDGYRRTLVCYAAPDGEPIEAFFFQPAGSEQRGAILALHQHNSQWEIGKREIAGLVGDPFQAFGPTLARRGVTVLAPDSIGFESRMRNTGWGTPLAPLLKKPHSTVEGWLQYYNQMAHRLVTGDLLIRKILEDSAAGLSVLQSLTKSDTLGVIGHSFGGSTALFLAALDTRVDYCCASGSVCSYRRKLADQTALEGSLIIPGFARHFDFDDLLRCVAPRRILVVSANTDPNSADAEELVRNALPTFGEMNCVNHLQHLRVSGGHALDQERFHAIVDWMVSQVSG